MAGDWIKIQHALSDKPEVHLIASRLGIDPDAVVGKLIRLWTWFDQQTSSACNAVTVTDVTLDRICHRDGFASAVRSVNWLAFSETPDGPAVTLPNFDRHNGETAKERALTNDRVAKSRSKKTRKRNADVTPTPLQKPLPEKRREEVKTRRLHLTVARRFGILASHFLPNRG